MITAILGRVSAGEDLSMSEMTSVVDEMMRGEWTEQQIMLLLNALRLKGETVDEIAGAAVAMRRHMTRVQTTRKGVLDTCGTGGVGSEIFNISTAAAIVAAAAGVPVAKHGNRSVTSKSGSSDVLVELGVNVEASVETVERCLEELGICFCFAPHFHPAMKHVAPARKKLGVRTIFNLLGPLCNPASADFQLVGVGLDTLRDTIASAFSKLGAARAVVVTGEDGMGEMTLNGATRAIVVTGEQRQQFDWRPADFGIAENNLSTLQVDGPKASAVIIREVLGGAKGPRRDIVVLNAAAALWTASANESPLKCAELAQQAIDSGEAAHLLERWVEVSRT